MISIDVYSGKAETQTEQNLNFLEPEKSQKQTNQSLPAPIPDQEVDIPIVIVEDIPTSVLTTETASQSTVPNLVPDTVPKITKPTDQTEKVDTAEIPTLKPKGQSSTRLLPTRPENRKASIPSAASELGIRTSPDKSIGEGKYFSARLYEITLYFQFYRKLDLVQNH